ncbi:hypothetical protein LJC59_07000 [Desulfovibrio sp. OttesenSCG-928-A18]|nr:hypothetical protein [Desulfovibrio sp. OttesenSCG-928-A18]
MQITLLSYLEGTPPVFRNPEYGARLQRQCIEEFALYGTYLTFEDALRALYASHLGTGFQFARCEVTGQYLLFDKRAFM